MSNSEDARQKLLREIVERELAMFLAAPAESGTGYTQRNPDAFRLMSAMSHSAHGNEFLKSYLDELRNAEECGRNFILEKYERMNGPHSEEIGNPLLNEIVDAETAFQNEAHNLYPDIIRHGASPEYQNYLRCGLEILSHESLEHYADEIRATILEGRNPVLERYNWLARKLGKEELA